MRPRMTIWLALLVLFLVSMVYILDHRSSPQDTVMASSRVFDITTEPITLMGMVQDGERIEMVRKDGDWFLQLPIRARASNLVMRQLAATAERLRSLDTITAEQRSIRSLSLADYGLDPAVGSFYLEAGGRREKISFGVRTPFGSGVYGLRHDTDMVIVLPEEALNLIEVSLDDLRDRSLFAGSQRHVNRVDLYRQDIGFLQLIRRGGRWQIQQPLVWPADAAAVERLLDALYVMQVQRFVWDAPADSEDGLQSSVFRSQVEEGNLAPDQARARITLWVEGSDTGEELFLGREYENGGQLYARRWGVPSVFTVPSVLGEIASEHVNDFRDQRVLLSPWLELSELTLAYQDQRLRLERLSEDDWAIREPVHEEELVRKDAVEDLLQTFMHLRIVSFDPQSDFASSDALVVSADLPSDVPENIVPRQLYLLPVAGAGEDVGLVGRIGTDGPVLRLTGFVSEEELVAMMHPARYRSRRILRADPDTVMWIQQKTVRGDVTIRRADEDEDENWALVEAREGSLDGDAIALLLATVADLDAAAVVDYEPASLRPFGLHAPVATLTLRYTGTDRLQESLLLGVGVEDERVYARLQGHGYIFRLSDEDAEILQGRLLLPPSVDTPDPAEDPDVDPSATDGGEPSDEAEPVVDPAEETDLPSEEGDIPLLLLEDVE